MIVYLDHKTLIRSSGDQSSASVRHCMLNIMFDVNMKVRTKAFHLCPLFSLNSRDIALP